MSVAGFVEKSSSMSFRKQVGPGSLAPLVMGGMPSLTKDYLEKLHTPAIYILGGEKVIAYNNGMDDFRRINHVPVFAANLNVGHGGTYRQLHGVGFLAAFRFPCGAALHQRWCQSALSFHPPCRTAGAGAGVSVPLTMKAPGPCGRVKRSPAMSVALDTTRPVNGLNT